MIQSKSNARNNVSLQTHNSNGCGDKIMTMKQLHPPHHNHVWACANQRRQQQEAQNNMQHQMKLDKVHLSRILESYNGGAGGGSSSSEATTTTVSCSTSLSSDGGVSLENLSLETIPLTSTTYMSEMPSALNWNNSVVNEQQQSRPPASTDANNNIRSNANSVGFSELMRAADDMLGSYEGHHIMSPVLEDDDEYEIENDELGSPTSPDDDEWEEIEIIPPPALGMLIVPGAGGEDEYDVADRNPSTYGGGDGWGHHSPLLLPRTIQRQQRTNHHQHHLSQKALILLSQAKSHVETTLLSQDSFEVSMIMNEHCTMEDVMRILGHPDVTLTSWFEPVQELVVTSRTSTSSSSSSSRHSRHSSSSSSSSSSSKREYDGEWINAVTPAGTLIPPKSSSNCLHRTKDAIVNMFGFSASSCGTLNMFVDKHLGQLSFVVGPFPGDIYASHTITVVNVQEGSASGSGNCRNMQVVDRVLLRQGGEGFLPDVSGSNSSGFVSGLVAASGPLGRCFLPSLSSYVEQTTSSMARLWVLVNHGETTTSTTTA